MILPVVLPGLCWIPLQQTPEEFQKTILDHLVLGQHGAHKVPIISMVGPIIEVIW